MTKTLPRLKPSPLPAIYPVPEYLADDDLKKVYEETKSTLQVPWMGVVTMAFAHYPTFFATLWQGLRELAASKEFVTACQELQGFTEDQVLALSPASIVPRLQGMGYAPQEIEDIRALNEIFSHGNMPYLMIATAARLLLEGHSLNKPGDTSPFSGRHGPAPAAAKLLLMEPHHVDVPTAEVYASIKQTLGLPFVNTDYRAFARWPSYFALAWQDLAEKVPGPGYEPLVARVHEFAQSKAKSLPNPAGLTPEQLQKAAAQDAPLAEVLEVVRLFQWLLPGLVTNVAYFKCPSGEPALS